MIPFDVLCRPPKWILGKVFYVADLHTMSAEGYATDCSSEGTAPKGRYNLIIPHIDMEAYFTMKCIISKAWDFAKDL